MTCIPSDWLMTTVRTRVPGVTDEMINLELFNAMNEFFRRSNAWLYEASVTLSEGTREYAIYPPSDTVLVRVISVSHDGSPVPPSTTGTKAQWGQRSRFSADELLADGSVIYYPDEIEPAAGNVFNYTIYYPNYLIIDAPPDANARLHPLIAILAISLSNRAAACDCGDWAVPEWMWDMFGEDWLDGTLARLMSMPAKPWSNPQIAQYHGRRFRTAMSFRRQEARRGFVNDVPAWRFPVGGFILR